MYNARPLRVFPHGACRLRESTVRRAVRRTGTLASTRPACSNWRLTMASPSATAEDRHVREGGAELVHQQAGLERARRRLPERGRGGRVHQAGVQAERLRDLPRELQARDHVGAGRVEDAGHVAVRPAR